MANSRIAILGLNYLPEPTGISPYTSALASGLHIKGVDVRVFTAHPHYPAWRFREGYGRWVRREIVRGVPLVRFRHYLSRRPIGIGRVISEISFGLRLLFARWDEPDVVLLVSPALFSSAIAMVRARLLSRQQPSVVVWVQDLYSLGVRETGRGKLLAGLMKWVESATFRAATGVVVIHPQFASYVVEQLGVSAERVEIIRNWTHLKSAPKPDVVTVRAQHGWAVDETVVLHAGNMGVKQGLENVVEAARLADSRQLPLRFVLVGDGNQREQLQNSAAGLNRIQFVPSLSNADYQAIIASADILLVNEKQGVAKMAAPSKLTSYFDAGRPIIAATHPAGITAGEVRKSSAGLVVAAGDPQALVKAALELRDDPAGAAEMGQNGHRYREAVLGEEAAITHFAEYLLDLANPTESKRPTVFNHNERMV